MFLLANIINNFTYLKQDYIGIHFSFSGILGFAINCVIPIILILVFYLVGQKIQNRFFKNQDKILNFFVGISLGYIIICTAILILGMLGILYLNILYAYYFLLLIIAVYPLSTLKKRLLIISEIFYKYKQQFLENKLVNVAILSFVLIAFLRLIPPEVGVDAIWYHTDYPRIYLNSHTMMSLDPHGKYYPAVTPTLSDMTYVFTESVNTLDASRFIHFGFYLLVVLALLLIFGKRYRFTPYAALLLITSPVIIRVASSAYAEFPWMLLWILSIFLITKTKKHNYKNLLLPAILFGGTLATKLWMLPFYGVFILYLAYFNSPAGKIKLLKLLFFFTIITFSVPFLWYLRAFIVTGNPLFPAFWDYSSGQQGITPNFSFNLTGLRDRILSVENVSPLSILGIIFLLPYFKKIKQLLNNPLVVFVIILTATQLIINYSYHRFVFPFFSIFAITLAFGIEKFVNFNKYLKYTFYLLFLGLFSYYFLNTLAILPYGLGIANQNNYLSRILSRDNSSYYDYNHQFSKLISNKDVVGTYGLWGFYYANFNHMYVEDYFRYGHRSLDYIEQKGATKLLILGKDMATLCHDEKLTDCNPKKYQLLTVYYFPTVLSAQYLYLLK